MHCKDVCHFEKKLDSSRSIIEDFDLNPNQLCFHVLEQTFHDLFQSDHFGCPQEFPGGFPHGLFMVSIHGVPKS